MVPIEEIQKPKMKPICFLHFESKELQQVLNLNILFNSNLLKFSRLLKTKKFQIGEVNNSRKRIKKETNK